jgi:predicted Zn-dependent peptidase
VKLDEIKKREIFAILTVGGTRLMAAQYVGCHVETIRKTALRDAAFADQLRKAELGPELTFLRNIQLASKDPKQWRASAWALERLFPDRYGRRSPDSITPEQLAEVIREMGTIVVGQVPVKRFREQVLTRLSELATERPKQAPKKRRVK